MQKKSRAKKPTKPTIRVELVYLSDDQTTVVNREQKDVTQAELDKLNSEGPPTPIVWIGSQEETMARMAQADEAREQERLELFQSLANPTALSAYCEDWRKRILGPALKTQREWDKELVDCVLDLYRTIWSSVHRIGGAPPPLPPIVEHAESIGMQGFMLLTRADNGESCSPREVIDQGELLEALGAIVRWCDERTKPGKPAGRPKPPMRTEPLTKSELGEYFYCHRNNVQKQVLDMYDHEIAGSKYRMNVTDMPPAYLEKHKAT